jgi:hypothetical protein
LLTDRLAYRWERLREEQRQQILGMVEHERQRQRQRARLYAALIVLVVVMDAAVLYLVLRGVIG